MHTFRCRRLVRVTSSPVYGVTDAETHERIIRDPLATLLGKCELTLRDGANHHDPYNRVGKFMRLR